MAYTPVKKSARKLKITRKEQDKFHANLPESERNPNQLEDFESLLLKAATTIEPKKKARRKQKGLNAVSFSLRMQHAF